MNVRYVIKQLGLLLLVLSLYPIQKIGSEFMPPLDEGDLLYMPTTLPGMSITKAREVLQQTDRIISTLPEVARVAGREIEMLPPCGRGRGRPAPPAPGPERTPHCLL